MDVADKSVATDELLYPLGHNTCLEVARLEAVLNTLVENKVESIKNNDKLAGIHASPRTIAKRLRITSSSTLSSREKDSGSHSLYSNRKRKRRKHHEEIEGGKITKNNRNVRVKQRISSSSPESARYSLGRSCERTPPLSDDDAFLQYDPSATSCCCGEDAVEVRIIPSPKYDEDYISLKIDEFDEVDVEAEEELEARRRARRKRRRRRRKRRRLKAMTVAVVEDVKVIDPDELPQRARWTIVATACILLFMCLMLVGVTLRMAPLIDDMVRKENEELMNSLHLNPATHHHNPQNNSPPTL